MAAMRSDGVRRRNELMDAALQCFDERGLLSTGIEDIRKAAGASPSSVYNLFGGLSDLTVALLIRTFERACAQFAADVIPTVTATDAVRALVTSHLAWVESHTSEARFMYQAMALELAADYAAEIARAKRELQAPVMDHLLGFAKTGELPAWTSEQLETVILGPSHHACRRFLLGGTDLAWSRRVLPDLAWRTVLVASRD